ncbi:MAG: glycosyltransferase, partial [Proteobacteria bacterium]|nr:glycosyltransferase [Pseudomonadota bacterium]
MTTKTGINESITHKLYLLVDSNIENNNYWLAKQLNMLNFSTTVIGMNSSMKNRTIGWRRPIHFFHYLRLAITSIYRSKPGSIIVSWNFIVGAIVAFICQLLNINRTIISLNMISHKKGLLNSFLRKKTYNIAFKYPKFYTTINSQDLLKSYSCEYDFNQNHFYTLPDCFSEAYETSDFTMGDGSVFCGGEAMRDWETLFKAATLVPEINFIAIARKINFNHHLVIPKNVKLLFDTDPDYFYKRLKGSSIVALPLSTNAPAGLIVMIRAALLSKPIIITSTPSTKNYILDSINGILIEHNDSHMLADKIKNLLSNPATMERI